MLIKIYFVGTSLFYPFFVLVSKTFINPKLIIEWLDVPYSGSLHCHQFEIQPTIYLDNSMINGLTVNLKLKTFMRIRLHYHSLYTSIQSL